METSGAEGDGEMAVVILPAYKPDRTLIELADKLWMYGCSTVAVDDGSGEEYRHVFEKVKDVAIVLQHHKNRGKGAAIKTALKYIRDEMWDQNVIGVMDSDGQHLPEDMMKLLGAARGYYGSMVLGVREVGKDMPIRSRLGNQITRTVFRVVSGVHVSDTQTGLRAFGKELIDRLLVIQGERYEYEMNVLMTLAKDEIPIQEVPIHTIYLDAENSCSHFRGVRDSVRIYKDILKFTLSSLSSFVVDYLLFTIFMLLMPHTAILVLIANVLARCISGFYNYSMNCKFVFHEKKNVKTAAHYLALAIFILCMNNLLLEMFVQIGHVSVYPAKLLTEAVLFVMSWTVQNCVIFRKHKYA